MNINDLDKIKVPKDLKKRLDNIYEKEDEKKKKYKFIYTMAACLILFLSGFGFPTYTKNLPIYSHIFSIFDMENYQEFGETVLMEKESGGIKVTIADIIYTGHILSYSYIIETDEFLGENLSALFDISNDGKTPIAGSGGSGKLEYKGNNTYIGYNDLRLSFVNSQKEPEELNLKINLFELSSYDENLKTFKEYDGEWKFKILVKQLDNSEIKPDFIFEDSGIFAKIDKLIIDKAGTKIQIKTWDKLGLVSGGHSYQEENIVLKTQNGEILNLKGGSAHGNKESFTMYYEYSNQLTEGLYTLEFDFKKQEFIGYNEKGEKERVKTYGTPEYENAPDIIKVSIPFEIK